MTPRGWPLELDCIKSASGPFSPDRQMFPGEKKAVFPFILQGLFDPEGLAAGAGLHKKRKRPVQPRQANVPWRRKAVFPFILQGLFDPEGLAAGAGL
ncbi:hypothetical protein [Rossellomorea aquimaris]|uniref:hypothetical protein n=1 Tax=Rossellomorea TaxID=2837508 RepID=UPI001653DDF5|nr:hypothetical protein [Rossellomorea aquimaris]